MYVSIVYDRNIQDHRRIRPLSFSHLAKVTKNRSYGFLYPFPIRTSIPLVLAVPAPVLTSKLFLPSLISSHSYPLS